MIPADLAQERQRVLELIKFTSPAPWDLDIDVMRGDDALGICRFDWEDEAGKTVYAVSYDADAALIAAAPDLAQSYAEALGELARVRDALAGLLSAKGVGVQVSHARAWQDARQKAHAALAPAPEERHE